MHADKGYEITHVHNVGIIEYKYIIPYNRERISAVISAALATNNIRIVKFNEVLPLTPEDSTDFIKALCDFLCKNKHPLGLELINNNLLDSHIEQLCSSSGIKNVFYLNLERNDIKTTGLQSILHSCPSLIALNVAHNNDINQHSNTKLLVYTQHNNAILHLATSHLQRFRFLLKTTFPTLCGSYPDTSVEGKIVMYLKKNEDLFNTRYANTDQEGSLIVLNQLLYKIAASETVPDDRTKYSQALQYKLYYIFLTTNLTASHSTAPILTLPPEMIKHIFSFILPMKESGGHCINNLA